MAIDANLLLVGVGAVTGLATLSGGLVALSLRKHIHLLLGLSAGAIMGVALLELLPEASRAGGGLRDVGLYTGGGFIAYLFIDRLSPLKTGAPSAARKHLGPASLTAHSLLDGLAIGIAFQASEPLGLAVATAVIAHDLSDGANTVNLGLVGGSAGLAFRWLLADAVAPVFGILLAQLVKIPNDALCRCWRFLRAHSSTSAAESSSRRAIVGIRAHGRASCPPSALAQST